MLRPAILLVLCLALLLWFVARDTGRYARFKLLTETADRQSRFRVWALKSFLLFSGTTVACLALLGRLHSLVEQPAEFRPLSTSFPSLPSDVQTSQALLGIMTGAVIGGIVVGFFGRKFLKRKQKGKQVVLGDIQPLMPRNAAETWHTALLSLNAGLSEEFFFRLLLPLLLAELTRNALAAFIIAGLIFGFVHFYQGKVGIIATTVLGVGFTVLYLWTGNIWIAAGAHAVVDLMGLVVRPTIIRLRARKLKAASSGGA